MFAKRVSSTATQVSAKLLVAIIGGYAFTSGYVGLSSILMVKLGMQMGEAVALNTMLGFIVYLCVMLWVFATVNVCRTSVIIIFMAVAMIIVAPYLAENL